MNEKVTGFFKNNRAWLIAMAVLLVWGVCGTISAVVWHGEYKAATAIIESAGGDQFVELVKQHGDTITGVLDDISGARGDIESAIDYAGELRSLRGRIDVIAERTEERLTEFETAVDNDPDIFIRLERRQQRIEELVSGVRADNRELRNTIGMCP